MQRHTKVLVVVVVVVVFLANMLVITIAIFPIKIYTNQKSVQILVNKQ